MKTTVGGLLVLILGCATGMAQPVFSKKSSHGGINVYADKKKPTLYYYDPGKLELAKDNFGKPDLKFIQIRYTGTQATGDKGKLNYKSILQFNLRMTQVSAEKLRTAKSELDNQVHGEVELVPLPVRKINTILVYAAIDDAGKAKEKPTKVSGGNMETAADMEENSVWQERTFTVALDNSFSQIFWSTLEKGQTAMSLAFSFYADGFPDPDPEVLIDSKGDLGNEILEELKSDSTDEQPADSVQLCLFKADAISISVDIKKNPELVKKVDVNESFVPPDFALLDVRCYDFNNQLRTDLYAKRIELEATGMNGAVVKDKRTFYSTDPDIYYAGVRFKYAVRMDKPFRYRIVEIKNDTAPVYGNWITEKNWNKLIDITTRM